MRLIRIIRRRLASEAGFSMAMVMLGMFVSTGLVVGTVTAVQGDMDVGRHDLDRKRAYEAAVAGLADYMFHLNQDTNYWSKCTAVPTPNAVNQMGSTTKKRSVPGSTGASYALELIPRSGQTSCSTSNPVGTMIEQTGTSIGTFRIRSTGYAGGATQRLVAQFRRASFLDYVYFTQLETSDPETYGDAATISGAYSQCTKTIIEGRYNDPIPNSGGDYCDIIRFVTGDLVKGPFHTNDGFTICGTPTFGRSVSDSIEVSSPPQGWYPLCSGSQPNFVGTFSTSAPVLTPPPTNGQLARVTGALKYTGMTRIVLNGANMTVTNGGSSSTIPIPASGVVYVANGACSGAYANKNPFTQTYPAHTSAGNTGCGTVAVRGTYSGKLTIAAENDIIVEDDITRTGDGLLGLVANNFVRVKHPICPSADTGCTSDTITAQTSKFSCNNGVNGTTSQFNLRIDAAILAIQHSFIVDHYNCGATLGTLTVNGAISQKFRGAVGTGSADDADTGYLKNYNYDDRLRYVSPPHFLDPVESAWSMQRQTLDP